MKQTDLITKIGIVALIGGLFFIGFIISNIVSGNHYGQYMVCLIGAPGPNGQIALLEYPEPGTGVSKIDDICHGSQAFFIKLKPID